MKVKIVTDSAQDFSPSYLASKGISVAPLTVHFGPREFKDGFDLTGEEFFTMLENSPHHPTTSQPSPLAFLELFRTACEEGSAVFAPVLSSSLSGTYQSAILAKEALGDKPIRVLDTRLASAGYGMVALLAARMAEEGKNLETIYSWAKASCEKSVVVFSVDTLDYLAKNGRIGKAQHLLGTLLNMKPILSLDDKGLVVALDRVRGKGKVIPTMREYAEERLGKNAKVFAAVAHANAALEAHELKRAIDETFAVEEWFVTNIGSVIGTHTGPGALAIFLMPCEI